jgi:hypothetical protein
MIDDLYKKEKKYVRQYLREDYIEKNSMMFDLQKAHALDTTKGIQNANPKTEEPTDGKFMGGLYSINNTTTIHGHKLLQ